MTRTTVEVNGKALAEQRRKADMSQQQLADKAGVSRVLLWRAESGRRVEASKIEAIAKALDVTPDDLRTDNGGLLETLDAALACLQVAELAMPRPVLAGMKANGNWIDIAAERERWGL